MSKWRKSSIIFGVAVSGRRVLLFAVSTAVFSTIISMVSATVFAINTSGEVKISTHVDTSIAMRIKSPGDTDPTCIDAEGKYAGEGSYSYINDAGGEIKTGISCASIPNMKARSFASTYSDVTVYTNSESGYALTLQAAEPDLINSSDPTQRIPAGILEESGGEVPGEQNKWSYKTDEYGNIEDWTAVTTSPATLRAYDQRIDGQTTRVTYGVSVGDSPAGKYVTTLIYTATMFDGENTSVPSIDIIGGDDGCEGDDCPDPDPTPDPDPDPDPTPTPDLGNVDIEPKNPKIPYKTTRTITIAPKPGHYINSIICSQGLVCTGEDDSPIIVGPTAIGSIKLVVTNNLKEGTGSITITTRPIQYPMIVAGDASNEPDSLTISTDYLSIPYAESRLVTAVTPATGYYLAAVNCPDGYLCTAYDEATGIAPSLNPVQTGEEAINPQAVVVTNNRTLNGGSLTFATKPRDFAIEITGLDENLGVDKPDFKVAYGHSKNLTITPSEGHYLDSFACPEEYTCARTDGEAIETGEDATGPQTVTITNNRTLSGGTLALTSGISKYTVDISNFRTTSSLPSLTIPYGDSREVTIRPNTGYYLDIVNCPSGYTCTKQDGTEIDTGKDVIGSQSLVITNNNTPSGGTLSFAGAARDFEVALSSSNVEVAGSDSATTLAVPYNGSKTITITPETGYYLSSVTCPTGYTCLKENGSEISTGKDVIGAQNITIINDGTTDGGTLTLTGAKRSFTVSITTSNVTASAASIQVPYGGSETVTILPDTGYHLSSFTCPIDYTCTKQDDTEIDTSENATSSQTIKITNNNTLNNGAAAFIASIKSYEVAITPSSYATLSTNSLKIPYGDSKTFTIAPSTGYYLTGVTCSSGYTCSGYSTGSAANPSATSRDSQTITVKNNNSTNTGAVSFTLGNTYRVSLSATKMSVSPSSIDVPYGGSKTATITPSRGYYLSSVSCPSGYSCSGYNYNTNGYFKAQTVTIKNNNTTETAAASFTATDPCAPRYGTDVAFKLADGKCWTRTHRGTVPYNRISSISCPSGMSKPTNVIYYNLVKAYGGVNYPEYGTTYGIRAANSELYDATGWTYNYYWSTTNRDSNNAWYLIALKEMSAGASGGTKTYSLGILCYGSV